MATIINISQGFATEDGSRSTNKVWRVVNTTLKDEEQLMLQAFLPLIIHEDDIPTEKTKMFDSAFSRFFNKGMFLLYEHFEALNDALDAIGFKQVTLSEDSNYFQPTLPGKYRPCIKAWKNNGRARWKEMKKIIDDFDNGNIDLDQYRIPRNVLHDLLEETPKTKLALARVNDRCDKILSQ